MKTDIVIVGGGVVGLATGYQLTERFPDRKVVILEKEPSVGAHQTGHNSGVLHSGIYYKPGSLKALNCRTGKKAMEEFCEQQGIDYDICGKVIVAVDDSEVPRLENILVRGKENDVACEMIDANRLAELEPHAKGVQAIHVPEAGIVDYRQVCERMAQIVVERGGEVRTGVKVKRKMRRLADSMVVEAGDQEIETDLVINCCGLQSDRVTRLSGEKPTSKIVPFRGEYYELKPEAKHLCNNLIYPVPNPSFPFLGVHFTRMIDGSIECGPNAVLAFAREGYRKRDINLYDICESLTYSGFIRLAWKYWRVGMGEMWRSFSKAAFVRALQRLMPEVSSDKLIRARAGVRAQAIARDGSMVDDFVIIRGDRVINVCNAPSPAATSSLNIGKLVVDKVT